ncbi:PD40 domain-containing protein [Candidatus Roseilinea sp. NK_OTU-006]|nr:PD40 domain-containing protein [Candidatus Roseilinea sp. NK_OTU-006]
MPPSGARARTLAQTCCARARLTGRTINFAPPVWSADGKTIYSAHTRDPDSGEMFRYADLVRFDAGNTNPHRRGFERIPLAGYTCYTPTPSPDGRWLAFDRSFEDPGGLSAGYAGDRATAARRRGRYGSPD